MTDDADTIAKKFRKAKTDPEALPSEYKGLDDRPEARNLVNIYAALADISVDQVLADHGGAQFGTFKPALAELAVRKTKPNCVRNDTADGRRVRNRQIAGPRRRASARDYAADP